MAKKKPSAAKQQTLVLDCSIALAWYFQDEADPYADAIALQFPAVQAVVPALWPLEVANGLLMGERRKRSTTAQASKWLAQLQSLPIHIDDEGVSRAWGDVLQLARSQNLSAYDAVYLELALRRGLPLATLDSSLQTAAKAVGVSRYHP